MKKSKILFVHTKVWKFNDQNYVYISGLQYVRVVCMRIYADMKNPGKIVNYTEIIKFLGLIIGSGFN